MKTEEIACTTLDDSTVDEIAITQEQYDKILTLQQSILNMLAYKNDTSDILDSLCKLSETLLPNSVASIMLKNDSTGLLNVISAPSVPQSGHDALANLKPGPHGGSCGNAVFKNQPQYVSDTFKDPRWKDIRNIAHDFNLKSCWSMPIRDEENNSIGSFALSSFENRSPSIFHKKLLETSASIVKIILTTYTSDKRLQLFSTAMHNAAEAIIITDAENKIIEVNSTFEEIYGYKEKDIIGKTPTILSSGFHEDEFYNEMWASLKSTSQWSGEIVNKKSDGGLITQWVSITSIYDNKNNFLNYLAIFTDLTELKSTQNKIQYMAYHDPLTGLFNKIHLEQTLESDKNFTLILLNINNFSFINTAYGFDIGDELLIKVSEILDYQFDIPAKYRINSDEFALIFNDEIDIKDMIISLQDYFYNSEVKIENITLNITFNYGAAYGNENLLRNAAIALKKSKSNGKNHFYIFDKEKDIQSYVNRESFISSNNLLNSAIDNDCIVPFFQAIHNNETNEKNKYEALVRIVKEDVVISPYTFIEPARLSGLLPDITKIMIEKSFKIMSSNNFDFSINITEDDLNRNYLLDFLKEKSIKYNIDPNRVILEILEGISTNGKEDQIEQLNEIKQHGFKLAIDDFGAEYSNFERVLDLEIDYLKIDAKYIRDIDTNKKSYEITKAIAYFAKNAKISCVAEFVHSESVQKIIKNLGIEFSQGYLFSEPNAQVL